MLFLSGSTSDSKACTNINTHHKETTSGYQEGHVWVTHASDEVPRENDSVGEASRQDTRKLHHSRVTQTWPYRQNQ